MSQLDKPEHRKGVLAADRAMARPSLSDRIAERRADDNTLTARHDQPVHARASVFMRESGAVVMALLAPQIFIEDRFELCVFPTRYMLNQTRHDQAPNR
jgi:hypothetical protein